MIEPNHQQKAWENPEQDTQKLGISRRVFLGTGMTAAAAAFILPREAIAKSISKVPSFTLPEPTPFCYPDFSNPTDFTGNELCVGEGQLTLPQNLKKDYTIDVRIYNDLIPGPTFRRNPGEKIEFTLINNLPPNKVDKETCDTLQHQNKPACFNTTTMHFHGLHVSPKSKRGADNKILFSSDDVFAEVGPEGQTNKYCVAIPEFHAPGTHWYHSHRHGSTAIQAANGMAGAIIIPEPTEERKLGVTDENDKIWLIQEILDVSDPEKFYTARGDNTTKVQFLVNGEYQPTLTIDNPNTLQRWRFINATGTPRGLMTLKLYKCTDTDDTNTKCDTSKLEDMYLIAVDGISFYGKPPQKVGADGVGAYKDGWELAPGNRADFLVNLPAGLYKIVKDNYQSANVGASRRTTQVLAYVKVNEGTDAEETIPECIEGEFPCYLRPIEDQEIKVSGKGSLNDPQYVSFAVNTQTNPRKYLIDGEQYPQGEDYNVTLGTAEQWVLSNPDCTNTSKPCSTEVDPEGLKLKARSPHPFHIHVNPFQVEGDKIDPDGDDEPSNWRWWDTIAVNPASSDCPNGTNLTIRHRFLDFDGEFVLHCHILIHEDQGMMTNVIVNGDGAAPCVILPTPDSCPYPAASPCPENTD
ncbi:MAG: multicopper oxidase domain-containing protein [Okeania sp. SIO3B5]|uniref:multicopper oxidase family protein n=1 Tax=Okeania sp. SIO3B5 TaxID=2607811 RepID=UPI00140187FA|nr:multicopper oxidase domain-containing protein [Okeania sp. SIO3B5]NEO52011.1 multicopper oxidase domain-containing protein [Okeania sp. SIO3B5]